MIDLDSDIMILYVEFDVTDRPWRGQAKNVLVQFYVLHWSSFPNRFHHYPLKTRMDHIQEDTNSHPSKT
jgi:hypothetical protein